MVIISFTRIETARITSKTSIDPIIAAPANEKLAIIPPKFTAVNDDMPKSIIATPKLAPELIPRTYGPAKGLRKVVCICNPLTARAAPASMAVIDLGNLKSSKMVSQSSFPEFPKNICNAALTGI